MDEVVVRYGGIYVISIILLYLLFKRFLYSILDPLVQFLLVFASLIAFSSDHILVIYILVSIFSFWLGMYTIFPESSIKRNFSPVLVENILNLRLYTYFLFILYTLSSIYVFSKSGIPLFSDNPSESKISIYDGMGILRRFSFIGSIIPINLLILIFVSKKKKSCILLLVLFCLLKIFQGSKSSLLGIIFPLYYLSTQVNLLPQNHISLKKGKKMIFLLGIIVLLILGYIVSKESEMEGEDFIYSLGFRLMEFGDAALYYKIDYVRSYFDDFNFLDYICDELNGILGMLRIVPYKYPLGFMMVEQYLGYTPDTVVGPNGIFIIKGHIYFGYVGGILYSFICGLIFAKIRKYYFQMRIIDIFWYALMTTIFFSLNGFLRESASFYSLLFDVFFYTMPFLFISQCLTKYYGRKV